MHGFPCPACEDADGTKNTVRFTFLGNSLEYFVIQKLIGCRKSFGDGIKKKESARLALSFPFTRMITLYLTPSNDF